MKNSKIIIKSGSKIYPIYLGAGVISNINKLIKKNLSGVKKICIISDKNIPSLHLKKLTKALKKYNPKVFKLQVNEKTKNFKIAYKLINYLLKNNFNRSDCVIAFGGGIVGDLTAFVGSITKRGIKFINIPTTLLAQVDASIGGKTAVNSNQGKNLIGTFYQPDFVLADMLTLNSLPKREMICGYGEILKHSLILDKNFFYWLNKNAKKIINRENNKILTKAVIQSCKIKSKIIAKDEKENNLRMVLNFGHTFAHGFEGAKNFSKRLNHGEAVLLGIMLASEFAHEKKILPFKDLSLIKKHYNNLNLPMHFKKYFRKREIKRIIYFMKKDKKNTNSNIKLILIKKIGKMYQKNIFSNSGELARFFNSRLY